jgi:hypothetical protein
VLRVLLPSALLFGFQCPRDRASCALPARCSLSDYVFYYTRFFAFCNSHIAQTFDRGFVQIDDARRDWMRPLGVYASLARLNAPFFNFSGYPYNYPTDRKKLKFGF